jgi:hypothetical protein
MALDMGRRAILFVGMTEADYRATSFLDERIVASSRQGRWLPVGDAARMLAARAEPRPLHFIFHIGHVGSTLLSRLLEATGKVLALREPVPLRALAEGWDDRAAGFDECLETMLRLWERGYRTTEAVILKATSATERLAPAILRARPQARAVLLNVGAESYLATMLAGDNSALELNALGPERLARLKALLNAPIPRPESLGELAAMSWLSERLTQQNIATAFGARVLQVDFDLMLEALADTLARVLAHFGLSTAREGVAAILSGETMRRYSKAPDHPFGPALRRQTQDEARRLFPREIDAALRRIKDLGRKYPAVHAVL